MKDTQERVRKVFDEAFGRTPLTQRLQDIQGEANELSRFTDFDNLREELGDLLSSVIQLANELHVDVDDCVNATLAKIQRRYHQYKSLGRKINVAIYGGAFDPITVGHIAVAKFVLDASKTFDEVWFTPCANHMFGKEMVSAEHRMMMCKLATDQDGRLGVFDYEIVHNLSGETYQFVKTLLEEPMAKDRYDFSMIIGMDNAAEFERWVNYELLEKMMRFVVVPRAGFSIENIIPGPVWFWDRPHIDLSRCENNIPEMSSTAVRNAIAGSQKFEDMVPAGVAEYIEKHGLYSTKIPAEKK